MFLWLKENIATIIIGLVLAIVVASIIYSFVKKKKKGVSSCGCSCGGCPMASKCHGTPDNR